MLGSLFLAFVASPLPLLWTLGPVCCSIYFRLFVWPGSCSCSSGI
uniref:Uncharacterized protein n=1 Tax=Setaria viridis TaxID=4556 RepID=A0A4U6TV51_SETVI|nr:hypothetical protein SEVIR_7G255250v2 [Setaria viridis]